MARGMVGTKARTGKLPGVRHRVRAAVLDGVRPVIVAEPDDLGARVLWYLDNEVEADAERAAIEQDELDQAPQARERPESLTLQEMLARFLLVARSPLVIDI